MRLKLLDAIKILRALRESKEIMEQISGGSCLVSILEALKIFEQGDKKNK